LTSFENELTDLGVEWGPMAFPRGFVIS
jgi:hypothetical protein